MKKIKTLLIANRGEIACRIIRTAKYLNIKTIAIYAEVDEKALHCLLADEAYCVGPIPVEKSYLNQHNILEVAKKCKADAIHPGYGFLSENAQFAKACEEHEIIFVGPPSSAIAKMAVKDEAKKIMQLAKVPIIPGYMGENQEAHVLEKMATEIGYPVLLKAAKGGGGKGMRLVHQAKDLPEAIASAKRESLASFGDDSLFIEKYLKEARHIEVQIFRDKAGHCVHLFERDCSLQRRHQKIIEEAPALFIKEEVKQKLYQAAIDCAHAIDYVGAGTVEFLYTQNEDFYFMEMNTRLQVEHPVTELITGYDLVEWQLRVAQGEDLPCTQKDIKAQGHAIEARIYAEDPNNHFLPATGIIKKIILPHEPYHYRLDDGIQENDKISIYFDPLLAKMIVHGANRDEAIAFLQQKINQFHLIGLSTNLAFLRKILQDKNFQKARVHTQYIEENLSTLLPQPCGLTPESLALAALVIILHRQQPVKELENTSYSPWQKCNAWRLNLPFEETIQLQYQQQDLDLHIIHTGETQFQLRYIHPKTKEKIELFIKGGEIIFDKVHAILPHRQYEAKFYIDEETLTLFIDDESYWFKRIENTLDNIQMMEASNHHLLAPMPGIITKIWISLGDKVDKGAKLLALEAMKMEHMLCAPKEGLIKSIYFQVGDQVEEGTQLIDIEYTQSSRFLGEAPSSRTNGVYE